MQVSSCRAGAERKLSQGNKWEAVIPLPHTGWAAPHISTRMHIMSCGKINGEPNGRLMPPINSRSM